MARLEEVRLLDDYAFARTLARSKWRTSKWGAPRLRMALAARQLPPAATAAALAELFGEGGDAEGEEAEEALLRAARQRWHLSRALAFDARERRLAGWLMRRGHGWRVARDLVATLAQEDADGAEEDDE